MIRRWALRAIGIVIALGASAGAAHLVTGTAPGFDAIMGWLIAASSSVAAGLLNRRAVAGPPDRFMRLGVVANVVRLLVVLAAALAYRLAVPGGFAPFATALVVSVILLMVVEVVELSLAGSVAGVGGK